MVLTLTQAQLAEMITAVQAALPAEGCGLLAGRANRVTRVLPITNRLHSPSRFIMDERELGHWLFNLDDAGEDLLGIFHAHPHSPARPSPTDLAENYYGAIAQVIVGQAASPTPQVRAFRYAADDYREISLNILPE